MFGWTSTVLQFVIAFTGINWYEWNWKSTRSFTNWLQVFTKPMLSEMSNIYQNQLLAVIHFSELVKIIPGKPNRLKCIAQH